jgi:hypothetical protein
MNTAKSPRRGIAIFMVMALMVVFIFLIGFMIAHSGDMRAASADQGQILRARAIAEAAGALAMADVIAQGQNAFGGTGVFKIKTVVANGDTGTATTSVFGGTPSQRLVTDGPSQGLRCFYIPVSISASGVSTGKGKVQLSMQAGLEKIPILQYGMFKQTSFNLGPANYAGPLHTNGTLTFSVDAGTNAPMTGPVTAALDICRNAKPGNLTIQVDPSSPSPTWIPAINACVGVSNQPPPVGGVYNVRPNIGQLNLPMTANAYGIIGLMQGGDPADLQKLNFDWIRSKQPAIDPTSRFVAAPGVAPTQSWISGPNVFFDPSAWRWCRVWDVDMAKLALSANKDSIFVLADLMPAWTVPAGATDATVIDSCLSLGLSPCGTTLDTALKMSGKPTFSGFHIINAAMLDRNLTISSPNVVYLDNTFNTTLANPADTTSYRNALIACDIVKFLGNTFQANKATFFNWYTPTAQSDAESWMKTHAPPALGYKGAGLYEMRSKNKVTANIRYNVSIINGEGWTDPVSGNVIGAGRFVLENWTGRELQAVGSKVFLWTTQSTNHRIQYYSPSEGLPVVYYYSTQVKKNFFDNKLLNISNMPPATPFLAQLARFDWKEGR